jgi:hypothetical protein
MDLIDFEHPSQRMPQRGASSNAISPQVDHFPSGA